MRNVKSINDVSLNKVSNLQTNSGNKWFNLNLLSKIFHSDDDELVITYERWTKLPYKIKTPLSKGPHGLNRIKCLCRKMLQVRMLLILNTLFDILLIIFFIFDQ